MRKILSLLVSLYLVPINWSKRLGIYAKGRILTFEEHYVATIDVARREFPGFNGLVVDIGAYDADSTIYLAKAFPLSEVVGFEPNPTPFKKALESARPFRNIVLHNLGVSEKEGAADFYVTEDAVSSSLLDPKPDSEVRLNKKTNVKITTLDSFFAGKSDVLLVKMDVQGAELRILKSGKEVLRNTRLVLTEMLNSDMYTGNCQYFQVDELLRQSDFHLHALFSNYNNQGLKYFDALYINNKFRNSKAGG